MAEIQERRIGERRRSVAPDTTVVIERPETEDRPRTLVRWSAIFAGAVIGLGLMALMAAFWGALAFDSQIDAVADNFEWFMAISAVVSLAVAGYLAGSLSAIRGAGPGMLQGVTLWATLLIVTIGTGLSSLFNLATSGPAQWFLNTTPGASGVSTAAEDVATTADQAVTTATTQGSPIWAGVLTLVVTLVATALAGGAGGATPRPDEDHVRRDNRVG